MSIRLRALLFIALLVTLVGGGILVWHHIQANSMNQADRLAAAGSYRRALLEVRNLLRDKPRDPELHLRAAQLQVKLADAVAAEKEFKTAISLGADQARVLPEYASSLITQGRYAEVLAIVPAQSRTPELTAKNLMLRAIAQLSLNDLPAAERTLRAAETQAPGRSETLLIGARVAAAKNDAATTEAKVDQILAQDPDQLEAILLKEALLNARGDQAASLRLLDRAIALAPWSGMARINRANILMALGRDDAAQADVSAVLELQPRSMEGIYARGLLMARRGQLDAAALEFSKLQGSATQFPQTNYYQGLLAERLGQKETAFEFARRYNARFPDDPLGVNLLARTALASDQLADVVPLLEAAVGKGLMDAETFDLLGNSYASTGRLSAALSAFEKAAALDPQSPVIQSHLGVARLMLGDKTGSVAALESAVAQNPDSAVALAALVRAQLDVGDLPKAADTLERLRTKEGDTEAVDMFTAELLTARGELDGAATILVGRLRRFPNATAVRMQLAKVLVAAGKQPEAQENLRAILSRTPARLDALHLYLGILARTGQVQSALEALEGANQAEPRQPAIVSMLADARTAAGKPDQAIALLAEQGKEELPPLLLGALSRAQAASNRFDLAKAALQALLRATPEDAAARGQLVALELRDKDYDGIRATMLDGLKQTPGNIAIMSTLVANERAAKGLDAAMAMAQRLRNDPANAPFSAALKGDVLIEEGKPVEAAKAFLDEYRLTPSLPLLTRTISAMIRAGQADEAQALGKAWLADHPDDSLVQHNLAQIDIRAGRYDKARASLDAIVTKNPNNVMALNDLAWVYGQLRDSRALATAQRAYLLSPIPAVADTLGWIMVGQGNATAALPLLRQAVAQQPGDFTARYHLSVALRDAGKPDEAKQVLARIAQVALPFQDRPAAEALIRELDAAP